MTTIYLAKNTPDTDVKKLELGKEEIVENQLEDEQKLYEAQPIDITSTEVAPESVENEISQVENVNQGFGMDEVDTMPLENEQIVEVPTAPIENTEEIGEEITVPVDEVVENNDTSLVDFKFDTNEEKEAEIDNADIQEENIDSDFIEQTSAIDKITSEQEEYNFADYSSVPTDKIERTTDYDVIDIDNNEQYANEATDQVQVAAGILDALKLNKKNLKVEMEKSKMKDEKIDMLTAQARSDKARINKLEERNDMLESELNAKDREIESLKREISSIRQSNAELNSILYEAKEYIDSDYDYTNEDLARVKRG